MSKLYIFIFVSTFYSCSHISRNEPLENTKKLTKEGHASLYQNGAFAIPMTRIKLIPPGPAPIELAVELSGASAKASFLSALTEAAESVKIVQDGTKVSYQISNDIWKISKSISDHIAMESKTSGLWIIDRSSEIGKKIQASSYELSPKIKADFLSISKSISANGKKSATEWSQKIENNSIEIKKSIYADTSARDMKESSKELLNHAKSSFITGYLELSQKNSKDMHSTESVTNLQGFKTSTESADKHRKNWSNNLSLIISNTISNYSIDATENFSKAQSEFENSTSSVGFTFASLKASGWILYELLWQGSLEPFLKMSSAGVGYIFVNGVAYPVILTANMGLETGKVLIQVTKSVTTNAYDIVAPTGQAAFATILSGAAWTSAEVVKGTGALVAEGVFASSKIVSPIAKYSVLGSTELSAKTIEYVGIPLAQAGVYAGTAVSGIITSSGGFTAGQTLKWGGEVASFATTATGATIASATLISGTAVAVTHASVNTLYQVGKSTTVPTAKILGGGLVLSYGTISQLAAHTVLAAADASYLVLSMEGPSFVVYSIQGVFSNGEQLPTNAVINLEELKKHGEIIKKIPVSDGEMQKVLNDINQKYSQ